MPKLERSRLLDFLSKPRSEREIAEHFNVPTRLASYQLSEAIKSGHVLITEKPPFKTNKCSNDKLKRPSEFVYVLRNSPMFAEGRAKSGARTGDLAKAKGYAFSVRLPPCVQTSTEGTAFNRRVSSRPFQETESRHLTVRQLKARSPMATELDASSTTLKFSEQRSFGRSQGYKTEITDDNVKALSHAEVIHLLEALLERPLAFLELHGRFGATRQTIRGMVRNGLLIEIWGPKAIGIRFKLTKKGKAHLKELEAAAKFDPAIREKSFIRLKRTTSL
jgi:hypothetical protein